MKKILNILLIVMLLFTSLILLTGCESKNDEKELSKNEVEQKISSYKEDAIITVTVYGGECTEDYEFYIFYKQNKIIEHKKFTLYSMSSSKEDSTSSEPKYTLKKYKIKKNIMKELKEIIQKAKDEDEPFGTTMNYKVKTEDKTYGIKDQKRISEIFKEFRGIE